MPFLFFSYLILAVALAQEPDFEVTGSTYAWELSDETPETVFDNLSGMAGCNSIYLIALMHGSGRPKNIESFPHNPVRSRWQAEDARIYWNPDTSLYGILKPALSDYEFLRRTDWLKVTISEARKRKLKVGAEISHTIIPKNVLARPEYLGICQRDIDGNPVFIPCPNDPEGRKYILALFRDLARNFDLDFIQTCYLPLWDRNGRVTDGTSCFCEDCAKIAALSGLNMKTASKRLKANPLEEPYFSEWWSFHNATMINLMRDIYETIHKENKEIEFRYNHHSIYMDWGRIIEEIAPFINSVRISDYREESGNIDSLGKKIRWIKSVKSKAGGKPVYAAIAVRPDANPGIIKKSIQSVAAEGVNGISLGHYESAPFSYLRACRVETSSLTPGGSNSFMGQEAEDMLTKGFSQYEYLHEHCIKADSVAVLTFSFRGQAGTYRIAVNATDMEGGTAILKLFVNRTEITKWELSEDTNCWRNYRSEKTSLRKGDLIELIVEPEGGDKPGIDYISFQD